MNLQTTEVTQDKLLPVEFKFVSTNIWKVKSVLRCLIVLGFVPYRQYLNNLTAATNHEHVGK